LTHALIDALLVRPGWATSGSTSRDTDEHWRDADSLDLLSQVAVFLEEHGFTVVHVDASVVCESPKLGPFRDEMRRALASTIGVSARAVNVKFHDHEAMGWIGRGEGVAAMAVATVERAVVRIFDTLTQRTRSSSRSAARCVSTPADRRCTRRSTSGTPRPFVVFSLLKRFLSRQYEVTFVSNITDVNDKIYAAAGDGSSSELAREMTARYVADTIGSGSGAPISSRRRPRRLGRSSRSSRT